MAVATRKGNLPVFSFSLEICVVDAQVPYTQLKSSSLFSRKGLPQFGVILRLDNTENKTKISEPGEQPKWAQTFRFQGHDRSKLSLTLMRYAHDSKKNKEDNLGSIETTVSTLAQYENKDVFHIEVKAAEVSKISLNLKITRTGSVTTSLLHDVIHADSGLKHLKHIHLPSLPSPEGIEIPDFMKSEAGDVWDKVLDRLDQFVKISDDIAEIHPYAKAAWEVVSLAYKMIQAQIARDARIAGLLTIVWETYDFVATAEPLSAGTDSATKSLWASVKTLSQQTVECAHFISEYAKMTSFATRTLLHMASSIDGAIQEHENKFKEIHVAIQQRAALQTSLTVMRISAKVDQIAEDTLSLVLNTIPYNEGGRYHYLSADASKDFAHLLPPIMAWVNQPNVGPRIFFLTGQNGELLTNISRRLCTTFYEQGYLASSVFCKPGVDVLHKIFGSISRDLSDHNESFRHNLYKTVKNNRALATSDSPITQFQSLILAPSQSCSENWENRVGSVFIVINLLDVAFSQSNDRGIKEEVIDILMSRSQHLPSNFRVLVTFCPMQNLFNPLGTIMRNPKQMADFHWLELSHLGPDTPLLDPSIRVYFESLCKQAEAAGWLDLLSLLNWASRFISKVDAKRVSSISGASSYRFLWPLKPLFDVIQQSLNQAHEAKGQSLASLRGLSMKVAHQIIESSRLIDEFINDQQSEQHNEARRAKIVRSLGEMQDWANSAQVSRLTTSTLLPDILTKYTVFDPPTRGPDSFIWSTLPSRPPLHEICCTLGTRKTVIDTILDWIQDVQNTNLPQVFVLTGPSGSGKSSVAHTVARLCAEQQRLGMFYYSYPGDPSGTCTISEILASLGTRISRMDPNFVSLPSNDETPLSLDELGSFPEAAVAYERLGLVGPIVTIIDTAWTTISTSNLVQVLAKSDPPIPSNFRFLIISPQSPSDLQLPEGSAIEYDVAGTDPASHIDDLRQFILSRLASLPPDRPSALGMDEIIHLSHNSFRQAAIICGLLYQYPGITRGRVASALRSSDVKWDQMISQLADSSPNWRFSEERRILHSMVWKSSPGYKEDDYVVTRVANILMELPEHQYSSQRLSPSMLSPSFYAYLLDPSRSSDHTLNIESLLMPFYESLGSMTDFFKWAARASEVHQLDESVDVACLDWVKYLQQLPPHEISEAFADALRDFLMHHSIHWLELLGRSGRTAEAASLIQHVITWLRTHDIGSKTLSSGLLDSAIEVQEVLGRVWKSELNTSGTRVSGLGLQKLRTRSGITISDHNRGFHIEDPSHGEQDLHHFSFSDDGRFASLHWGDGTCQIVAVRGHEGHVISTLEDICGPSKFVGGGQIVMVTRNGWKRWNLKNDTLVQEYEGIAILSDQVAISDGGRVAIGAGDEGWIRVWDTSTGAIVSEVGGLPQESDFTVAFMGNERFVIVYVWSTDEIRMYELVSGKLVRSFKKGQSKHRR